MVQKITLERLIITPLLSNIFERSLAMENIWKTYQNQIENNFCQTKFNTFTFFFYFLTGFLRNGLRKTFKFKLSNYFVNQDFFDLHIGQTHYLNSTNLFQLNNLVNPNNFNNLFVNPLIFIRVGRYYIDRVTMLSYIEDFHKIFENQIVLENSLVGTLNNLEGLFSMIYQSFVNYYRSITFSY
jgi:hypothetical protein